MAITVALYVLAYVCVACTHLAFGFRVLGGLLLGHQRLLLQHLHRVQLVLVDAGQLAHQKHFAVGCTHTHTQNLKKKLSYDWQDHRFAGFVGRVLTTGAQDAYDFEVCHIDFLVVAQIG